MRSTLVKKGGDSSSFLSPRETPLPLSGCYVDYGNTRGLRGPFETGTVNNRQTYRQSRHHDLPRMKKQCSEPSVPLVRMVRSEKRAHAAGLLQTAHLDKRIRKAFVERVKTRTFVALSSRGGEIVISALEMTFLHRPAVSNGLLFGPFVSQLSYSWSWFYAMQTTTTMNAPRDSDACCSANH